MNTRLEKWGGRDTYNSEQGIHLTFILKGREQDIYENDMSRELSHFGQECLYKSILRGIRFTSIIAHSTYTFSSWLVILVHAEKLIFLQIYRPNCSFEYHMNQIILSEVMGQWKLKSEEPVSTNHTQSQFNVLSVNIMEQDKYNCQILSVRQFICSYF